MSFSIRGTRSRTLLVRCATTAVLILAAKGAFSQSLPEATIIDWLQGSMPSSLIENRIKQRGIAFEMSPVTEKELRSKGASDSLVQLLIQKSEEFVKQRDANRQKTQESQGSGGLRSSGGTGQPPQQPAAVDIKPVVKPCPPGVYCDPDTNLMWTIKDNGNDIIWPDAGQYCGSLTLAGLSGWELPTIDQLEKLYDPRSSSACKIQEPFRLTACCPWSSTKEGSLTPANRFVSRWAWYFDFGYGKRLATGMAHSSGSRALCVRRSGE